MSASYVEIYNEQVRDLLKAGSGQGLTLVHFSAQPLAVSGH